MPDPCADHAVGPTTLFGMPVDPVTMETAVTRCLRALETRAPFTVGVLNAAKTVKLRTDGDLRESLLGCDMLLADGQAVVWAGNLLGCSLPERVTGIDLFTELLGCADAERRSVYLLGARPEVLDTLVDALTEQYPGLRIAGHHHGYFDIDDCAGIVRDIRDSGADMLFIGMPSPLKENFLRRWETELGVPLRHGVGGSFDVLAGFTKRAPERWQRLGLEWAYRLVQEPRRMWRRYLDTNTRFVALALAESVRPTPPYERAENAEPKHRPTVREHHG